MHLTNSEIMLYATEFGLTESQRNHVEKHLLLCEDCNTRHQEFAKEIRGLVTENELECQSIEDDMADYILGEISPERQQTIEKHLETCENCRYFYYSFGDIQQDLPDETTSGQITLSTKLTKYLADLKELFGTIINLSIEPLPVAPAFMGRPQAGMMAVSHKGGNLCLSTLKPFQRVSLLTTENLELKTMKADEFGVAVFEDYLPGKYQVCVEGFSVKDIRYISTPK